jgi:hypothetical protein
MSPIAIYVILIVAAAGAYWNVRQGRGDTKGAFRVAAFMTVLLTGVWAVKPHVGNLGQEQERFFAHLGLAMFVGLAMYVLYLGLEPYVRRAWPDMLVGWTRVVAGRVRDPLVGHDVLIGVTCGAVLALLTLATIFVPPWLGLSEPQPHLTEFPPLFGIRGTLLTLLGCVNIGMQNMLITTFEFAGFRALFERLARPRFGSRADAISLALAIMSVTLFSTISNDDTLIDAIYQAISITLVLQVLLRIGIFSATVMFATDFVLRRMPFSFDTTAFYTSQGWFALALLIGLAALGYWMALHPAGRSRFAT